MSRNAQEMGYTVDDAVNADNATGSAGRFIVDGGVPSAHPPRGIGIRPSPELFE